MIDLGPLHAEIAVTKSRIEAAEGDPHTNVNDWMWGYLDGLESARVLLTPAMGVDIPFKGA